MGYTWNKKCEKLPGLYIPYWNICPARRINLQALKQIYKLNNSTINPIQYDLYLMYLISTHTKVSVAQNRPFYVIIQNDDELGGACRTRWYFKEKVSDRLSLTVYTRNIISRRLNPSISRYTTSILISSAMDNNQNEQHVKFRLNCTIFKSSNE